MSADSGAILVLGGRSDIGIELTTRLCAGSAQSYPRPVVLAARGEASRLAESEAAVESAGARRVHTLEFDATDFSSHREVVERATQVAGVPITTAIVAFGILGDQSRAERDEVHAADIATVDYSAQVSMLTVLADVMSHGHIVAFSSIAGWRARRANYVYGSTKAGLDAFCQGLADRLHGSRLALITARPGFVIGSMTKGMKAAPMSVTPGEVAGCIAKRIAQDESRFRPRSATLWIPGRLRFLVWGMRLVPRPLWRHMPR